MTKLLESFNKLFVYNTKFLTQLVNQLSVLLNNIFDKKRILFINIKKISIRVQINVRNIKN